MKFYTSMIGLAAGGISLVVAGCGQDDREQRETVQTTEQRETAQTQQPETQRTETQQREGVTRTADSEGPVDIPLYEEDLEVEAREVPAGGVVIQRQVETETVQEDVDLRHETVEVTRVSPEEAEQRQLEAEERGEPFSEEEVFIPLAREEAVAETEPQVREVVRAERGVETEQHEVEEEVRREVVEYEDRAQEEVQERPAQQRQRDQEVARQQQGPAQQQTATHQRDAQELEQRVHRELAEALPPAQLEQIEIRVEERTVELVGTVPDEQASLGLEDHVRSIEGVEHVENRLQVAQR